MLLLYGRQRGRSPLLSNYFADSHIAIKLRTLVYSIHNVTFYEYHVLKSLINLFYSLQLFWILVFTSYTYLINVK